MPGSIWMIGASFAAFGFAFSLLAAALVKRSGIVDAPDSERKTQSFAVPRLGGVAILVGTLLGFALGFLLLFTRNAVSLSDGFSELYSQILILIRGQESAFAFVAVAFLIGLWDDIWTANTKLKLLILALACFGAAVLGTVPEAVSTPWGDVTLPAILIIGSALWMLVFSNAVNFIDGSNGMAGGSLAIMFVGLASTGAVSGDWSLSVWWFVLLGALAGFLLHNLRGTLYLGDAGALGLGALFAALGLLSGLEVWTIATLALPFLLDVLLTLVWRAKHGRNWLAPHLDHAYQRLIASGWTHIEVAVLYWGLCAACGAAAYIGALAGGAAPFAIFWALCLAGIGVWVGHRRTAKPSNLGS
ncbi:MAG: hypothetical protein AAGL11_04645 [Pseudomonadota bacterium]